MPTSLIALLMAIAQAASASAYLEAQDRALSTAAAHYEELVSVARTNAARELRFEAVGLICLLNRPDAKDVLLSISKTDKDASVNEFAKALLYRLIVAETTKASGKVTSEQFVTYQTNVRRMGAEALFNPISKGSNMDQ
jgi:hypothetical protein